MKKLVLAIASICAAAAPAAYASESFTDRARVVGVRPVHDRIPVTREECWNDVQRGYEERRVTRTDTGATIGPGTVLGAIVGGVVGHQFGSGRGNDAATVAGALGGAAVGHEIAENRSGRDGYRVNVRLDNGGLRTFYQDDVYGLNVGDRVQVDSDRVYRYAESAVPYDSRGYDRRGDRGYDRRDDRGYDRRDDRGYRSDANGYRLVESSADIRYLPNGRLDRRVYQYDSQGYRVDQWGNRYDAEGYWVDERGNRHEYQDPPMGDDVPGRLNHPQ